MKFLDKNTIKLDKIENDLDKFVFDFIKIIEKHTKYVIISGYVSILFGRSRATEDIDIFIERLGSEQTKSLYEDLIKNSYYCLNSNNTEDIFEQLKTNIAVRFAKKNTTIPNFEIKFVKNDLQKETINNPLRVLLPSYNLFVSTLEQQIAYKRYFLKSDKDIEDAQHLEKAFEGQLNKYLIQKYRKLIERYYELKR